MSAWPGKYVIGLTGNIATGKSVVRKMLEHLGVYGIDADALAHRAIASCSPGYKMVVEMFGQWIVAEDGQIDRARLAKIVFNDAEALLLLEQIIHPLVEQAVDLIVRRSKHKVVVIEAIKLLEGNLSKQCDQVWVTYTPDEVQLQRLLQKRGMSEEAARGRITAQSPQQEKMARANQVIINSGSFEDTWQKVYTAWLEIFPGEAEAALEQATGIGELVVQRALPRQSNEIARFMRDQSKGMRKLTASDIMAAFGEKAFLLLKNKDKICGLVGWKVENLVACVDDIYLDRQIPFLDGIRFLIEEVERASKELQCEISLLFLHPDFSHQEPLLNQLGYRQRTIQSLEVHAWEEAALEGSQPGYMMFFKQLRKDRVLRPV